MRFSMFDVATDSDHRLLKQIVTEQPDLQGMFKNASVQFDDLRDHSFADPNRRLFPIHTKDDAVLSKLYAVKQASEVPAFVMARIDKVLDLYGVDVDELEKQASAGEKTASQRVEPVHYLLPHEQAIPVSSAAQVKEAALALTNPALQREPTKLTEAATNAIRAGAAFSMDHTDLPSQIYKLAGLTTCDPGMLLDWVDARAYATRAQPEISDVYTKIAQSIYDHFPATGVLEDRDQLIKIAGALSEADEMAGLQNRYGRRLVPPVEAVFNMDKLAMGPAHAMVDGQKVSLAKLRALPDAQVQEFFGEDASFEGLDDENVKSMVETLPADIQKHMMANLKSYLT